MYPRSLVEASKTALMEVLLALEDYKDHLVLGGGWASYFVLDRLLGAGERYGSADVDLFLEPRIVKSGVYEKIASSLLRIGYRPYRTERGRTLPYRFYREVASPFDNRMHLIKVDFITEAPGKKIGNLTKVVTGRGRAGAVAIRGASVVLSQNFEYRVRGALPSGGADSVKFNVADLTGCLYTKALAIKGRDKKKDFYDIANLLKCSPKGFEVAAPIASLDVDVLELKDVRGRMAKMRKINRWKSI